MNKKQIEYILKDNLNYTNNDLNDMINLEKVAEIVLLSNENIYPDSRNLVKFDLTNEILEVYHKSDNVEIPQLSFLISFEEIEAFILETEYHTKSQYIIGKQM